MSNHKSADWIAEARQNALRLAWVLEYGCVYAKQGAAAGTIPITLEMIDRAILAEQRQRVKANAAKAFAGKPLIFTPHNPPPDGPPALKS